VKIQLHFTVSLTPWKQTEWWVKVAILTYLLTPWCRVLLEKLTSLQLVRKFPAFYGTRRFITELTSVRHLSLSWASPIQYTYPHPTSWRSILILSTHLRLGLPSGSFIPVSLPRPYTPPSPHPYAPHAQPISFFSISIQKTKSRTKSQDNWVYLKKEHEQDGAFYKLKLNIITCL